MVQSASRVVSFQSRAERMCWSVDGQDSSEVKGVVVEFWVEFLFDVWWDMFGVDFEFVDDLAFVVDSALFDYRSFDLLGFFECEFAFFYFVGFSAGDRAACFDDFVHVFCGDVDGELVGFFNELMRVSGRANGYDEDRCSPERADEAPTDRHHVAFSSLACTND